MYNHSMKRTQIYIEEQQAEGLKSLSVRTGESQSELIRRAINHLLDTSRSSDWRSQVRVAAGLWEGRDDAPMLDQLRKEFDRELE
jgi:Arc/MetJ-type ribon-helix-helix transcriptional regulator